MRAYVTIQESLTFFHQTSPCFMGLLQSSIVLFCLKMFLSTCRYLYHLVNFTRWYVFKVIRMSQTPIGSVGSAAHGVSLLFTLAAAAISLLDAAIPVRSPSKVNAGIWSLEAGGCHGVTPYLILCNPNKPIFLSDKVLAQQLKEGKPGRINS